MSFDLSQDNRLFFADFGVDITLRPGTGQELTIEQGCLPSQEFYQAEVGGGKIGTFATNPQADCLTEDVGGLVQGDQVRIHATPRLNVAGGLYRVVSNQPDGSGFSLLELLQVEEDE
jgi:hypothetical protein